MQSYNDIMDTIIYLKIKRRQSSPVEEPALFHIRPFKMWEMPERLGGGMDSLKLLHVTLPEAVKNSPKWPMELSSYLTPFFGYSASITTILHDSVEHLLPETKKEDWWRYWPYPLYREYQQPEYARFLVGRGVEYLQQEKTPEGKKEAAQLMHFYILGYKEFVPRILEPYLKQIKTLTFFVAGKQNGLEEYLEDLYEEEGLAADRRILEEKELRRLRPQCTGPALVLDLSGEERIVPSGTEGRLAWIDMDSNEAKRRRIQGRYAETAYFSMKVAWGSLDTVDKNRYNT